jgi:uncharacterized delta-60 repeat protein
MRTPRDRRKERSALRWRSAFLGAVATVVMLVAPAAAQARPGDPDTAFGSGGVFTQQLGGGGSPVSSFADTVVQPDGKVLVAGYATPASGSNGDLVVARLLPNGTLDSSFASNGIFNSSFDTNGVDQASEILARLALAPDGGILVSFITDHGSTSDTELGLIRLTAGGALDPSFGAGGVLLQQLGAGSPPATQSAALAVQGDGRILVAGDATDSAGNLETFVERLGTSGSPDPTFATGGVLIHDFSQTATVNSVATGVLPGPNGTYMIGGRGTDSGGNNSFFLASLSSAGGVGATTFVQLGRNATTPSSTSFRLVQQPSGKFVLGGLANTTVGTNDYQFALARFNGDGSLDTTFGSGGQALFQPSTASPPTAQGLSLAVQGNGRLLMSGIVSSSPNSPLTIVRFTPDGSLDSSFGASGIVTSSLGQMNPLAYGVGLAIGPDGQLVVAGLQAVGANFQAFVARFLLDQPPVAAFSFSPASPTVGQVVNFDASGSSDPDGTVSAVDWDMGSGSFTDAHGVKPSFTFTTPGAHVVRVRVTDDDGLTAVASQTVTVAPAPVVAKVTPALPSFGGMTLGSRSLQMDKHGNVFVTLFCPVSAVSSCSGTVTLSGESDGSAPRALIAATRHKKKTKPRLIIFGSASFTVAAGRSVKVKVHLSSRAQALVRRKHRLTAKLVVRDHDHANRASTTTAKATIKAPKAKKKPKKKH